MHQVNRAQRLIENREADANNSKRSWFQTHKERQQEKGEQMLSDINLLHNLCTVLQQFSLAS